MKKLISILTSSALLTAVSVPSAFAAENGTDYKLVCQQLYGSIYNVTVTNPDGTTYDPAENKNENVPEHVTYIYNAAEVCIDEVAYYEEYKNKSFSTTFETNDKKMTVQNGFPGQVVINDKELTLKNSSSDPNETDYLFEINFRDTSWTFSGDIDYNDDVKIAFVDNGFILKRNPDTSIPTGIDVSRIKSNGTIDNIEVADDFINAVNIDASVESIMVSLDENDSIVLSIDPDKDGVFEAVEKGDANFDGYVSASDASAILRLYSQISTGTTTEVNNYIADYNGDGVVNANDASDVLKRYSEISTAN